MNIYEYICPRSFLESLLKNETSKISLRSFARKICVSPSTLSDYLRRNGNVSLENALKISHGLSLNLEETDYFLMMVVYETLKTDQSKKIVETRLNSIRKKNNLNK